MLKSPPPRFAGRGGGDAGRVDGVVDLAEGLSDLCGVVARKAAPEFARGKRQVPGRSGVRAAPARPAHQTAAATSPAASNVSWEMGRDAGRVVDTG
jgi:hypothetical protein